MKVLIACEFTGVVRRAFEKLGHNAWSCDVEPSEDCSEKHYQGDVCDIIHLPWDLMIAHPPCTHLAISGARWFNEKSLEQEFALKFVQELLGANIPKIAIENPISIISSRIRKPDQIIEPWWFGHPEPKQTCLWLKNLPKLKPTNVVEWGKSKIHYMPPSEHRSKDRSRTYEGIAAAMANQWGRN